MNEHPVEIKVRVKDEDVKVYKDFLEYDPFTCSLDDPKLQSLVHETLNSISTQLVEPQIEITIKMQWS